MNYAKLLEISSFFTWHIFLEVGKTQDMLSKIWQTLGDALTSYGFAFSFRGKQKKKKADLLCIFAQSVIKNS